MEVQDVAEEPVRILPDVVELAQRLGLESADLDLLRQALQHPSYVRESDSRVLLSNQRLEFLGDAVLDLVLADHLFQRDPRFTEGHLTKLKSSLVREDSLARIGQELGLGDFLLLGRGEEDTGGRAKRSLIADSLEAIIAVAYLSGGFGAAREFILRHFAAAVEQALAHGPFEDPKTRLQELLQERTKHGPSYHTVPDEGPPHEPLFRSECRFRGRVIGVGRGRTKRDAEKAAASDALAHLDEIDLSARPPAHARSRGPAAPPSHEDLPVVHPAPGQSAPAPPPPTSLID